MKILSMAIHLVWCWIIFLRFGLSNFAAECQDRAMVQGVFAYPVNDPERYGVVDLMTNKQAYKRKEKPSHPKSNYAVPSSIYYDDNVVEIAKNISHLLEGEYEITTVNQTYLNAGKIKLVESWIGTAWLDTIPLIPMMLSEFVRVIEKRQGYKIRLYRRIACGMVSIN